MIEFGEPRIVRRYYAAILSDGSLWCATSDAEEVIESAEGIEGVAFRQTIIYEQSIEIPWYPEVDQHG